MNMAHIKLTNLILESNQGIEVLSEEDSKKIDDLSIRILKRVLVGMKKDDPAAFEKLVPILKDEKSFEALMKDPKVQSQSLEIKNQLGSEKEQKNEAENVPQVDPTSPQPAKEDPIDKIAGLAKKGRDALKNPGVATAGKAAKFGLKAIASSLWGVIKLANWIRRQTGDIKFAIGLGIMALLWATVGPKKMVYGAGVAMEYAGKAMQVATSEKPPEPPKEEKKSWYSSLVGNLASKLVK